MTHGQGFPMLETILGWLHAEREVMRRAPWLTASVAIAAAIIGFLGATALNNFKVAEAQQAVATAQLQRDFWKDKYEDATKPGKSPATRPAPPAQGSEIDVPKTALVVGLGFGGGLLALLFIPLPGQRQKPETKPALAVPSAPDPPMGRLMTAPRPEPEPPPPMRYGTGNVRRPPSAPDPVVTQPKPSGDQTTEITGYVFLEERSGETRARPQLMVTAARRELMTLRDGAKQVRAILVVANETASQLKKCTLRFDRVEVDNLDQPIDGYIYHGTERVREFGLPASGKCDLVVAYRNFNVAPEEPMRLNIKSGNVFATPPDVCLKDNKTHYLKITVDSGAGVVTRAVVKLVVGEYEDLEVSLIGQAWWRQSQPNTAP